MMLLGVKLAGETELGKGPGEVPGPASHWVLRAKGRLTYPTVHCHTSLRKRGPVRQEEGVTGDRMMKSGALRVHVQDRVRDT